VDDLHEASAPKAPWFGRMSECAWTLSRLANRLHRTESIKAERI
jgi:hypothetical protein